MSQAGEELGEMMTGYQAYTQTGEEHGIMTEHQDSKGEVNIQTGEEQGMLT